MGSLPCLFLNPTGPPRVASTLSLPYTGIRPSQITVLPPASLQHLGLPNFPPTGLPTTSLTRSLLSISTLNDAASHMNSPRLRATSCQPLSRTINRFTEPRLFFPESSQDYAQPLDLTLKPSADLKEQATTDGQVHHDPGTLQTAPPCSEHVCNTVNHNAPPVASVGKNGKTMVQQLDKGSNRRRRKTTSSCTTKPLYPPSITEGKNSQPTASEDAYKMFRGRTVVERALLSTVSDNEEYVSVGNGDDETSPSFVTVHLLRPRRSQSANEDRFANGKHNDSETKERSSISTDSKPTEGRNSLEDDTKLVKSFKVVHEKADSSVCNPRMRRFPEMTPKEVKDETYWEKRVKNNEAARRSRRARKTKETKLREYAEKLEKANAKLLGEIEILKSEVCRLKSSKPDAKDE
ncbi:par domain protein [Clonorchis sinensis]|uniref:Par domain protein n=1 Tax=Clonorchis sinensis TaxID=79923 RepID=H2KSQ0_CLOSI|nr:par domain protein [Clonorchis sinensis]